jgi:NAD+ kinase
MAQSFRNAAIFAKPRTEGNRPALHQALNELLSIVERAGVNPLLDAASRDAAGMTPMPGFSLTEIGARADVAIVLGGDGTMLGIAREMSAYQVPMIGINFGRLGFITDIAFDQMPEVLADMLAGRYETDRRPLLQAEILRAGAVTSRAHALNDVVVSHGVAGGMVEFTVRVDGVTMCNQRADGVILATPTGSTAYALSASGPILHPSLRGLVLVPVAPHTLSNRPIALPDGVVVEIELTDVRDASAHFDMQAFSQLASGDVVRARLSDRVATLLHPPGYNYFATLRHKLQWNVMSSEEHGRA